MPEDLDRHTLNALSKAKDACINSVLSCAEADRAEISWAVNRLYRDITGADCPEIKIAEGPLSAKVEVEARVNVVSDSHRRKNLNDAIFKYVIASAEDCLNHLRQVAPEGRFTHLQNMVFRDLNARISRACADPVRNRLLALSMLPDKHAHRPSVSPSWGDIDWVRFYEICEDCCGWKFPLPPGFSEFLNAGGMLLYAFDDFACAVLAPTSIALNDSFELHGDEVPAISWADGTALFFHNGVAVPQKLVEQPDEVTREEIMAEANAEVRRCYREILGSERFGTLLGLVVIDEGKDRFGYDLTLYRTEKKDKLAGNFIQFAGVTCPSTGRRYFLCVPPHIKSAREAVAWSFGKTAENYRPEIET